MCIGRLIQSIMKIEMVGFLDSADSFYLTKVKIVDALAEVKGLLVKCYTFRILPQSHGILSCIQIETDDTAG